MADGYREVAFKGGIRRTVAACEDRAKHSEKSESIDNCLADFGFRAFSERMCRNPLAPTSLSPAARAL
jgi:hypothetical protein